MRIVKFKATEIDENDWRGEVKVQGYYAVDYGTSKEDVKTKLIDHLVMENEISLGNYSLEETPTE